MARTMRRAAERAARKQERKEAKGAERASTDWLGQSNYPAGVTPQEVFDSVRAKYIAKTRAEGHWQDDDDAAPSQARVEANRANAQHSTGPRTTEGKAASSQNSFKHGLYSKQIVLQSESEEEFQALRKSLHSEHKPVGETESLLVDELVESYWLMRRYRWFETQAMETANMDLADKAQRMHARSERSFHKALKTLRELQKDRRASEQPAKVGFVPTKAPSGSRMEASATAQTTVNAVSERRAGQSATPNTRELSLAV